MKFRSTTAAAALVIGAMTIGTTVAHAEPAAPAEDAGINYSTKLVDKTIVSTLKNGTFEVVEQKAEVTEDGVAPEKLPSLVNVKDISGATVISFPLEYSIAGVEIPVKSELKNDGKVLEITPVAPAEYKPVADQTFGVNLQTNDPVVNAQVKDIASPSENQAAMSNFGSQFSLATAIGAFVGTAIGAIVGCALGLIGVIVGCIVGLPTGATIGGILGTIAVGGPTLLAAGIELMQTLQADPGTSKWANGGK
ncbi:hypothetical protein [Nocardia huaxiensis]|uniref:DUF8020 domain-containing protein n=1 Tax=Nocardia huaxiensis TaxID=2755382 RepID=A0A7D6ZH59_9NOCA|nr:hypothetical protein [Nocardia huaxiensis]QLY30819.1 hypothetical protein H0264_38040 [Nocardia huaxiensis]UFS94318.1 hypothetical protein LPY97_26615 [Nocardia huaxiensis]